MKKWIRWQGLIGFVVVTGLVAVLWFFFVDSWAKRAIEKAGTLMVGAKVELDSADVTFSPLGMTLNRLQVTNPDKPMENAVEIKRIAFNLETAQLFLRKAIIDEMTMDGMEFGTARKYSGEVQKSKGDIIPKSVKDFVAKQTGPIDFPAVEVPDIQEILKREDLASVKLVETIRKEIDDQQAEWKKRIDDLPNEKTFEEYRQRVDKLKKGVKAGAAGALVAASDISKLPQEIRQQIDKIDSARTELGKTIELVQKRAEEAKKAPFDDINRLKDKYNLSGKGMANLTRTFVGPQYANYLSQAFLWHSRIAPYLQKKKEDPKEKKPERGKGIDVRFRENRPLPDFLIKKSLVTLKVNEVGAFKGEVLNITEDQPVWGQPLKVNLAGDKLETVIKSASLGMVFDHVHPDAPKDTARLEASGYELNDVALSKNDKWPITLKHALISAVISLEFIGDAVNGGITTGMSPVEIVTGFDAMKNNPIAKAISGSLHDIKQLNIQAEVHGKPEDYDLTVKSNLDQILENALDRIISETVAEFEKRLKAEIMKRVEKPLAEIQSKIAQLTGNNPQLEKLSREGDKILQDALKNTGMKQLPIPGGLKMPKLFK